MKKKLSVRTSILLCILSIIGTTIVMGNPTVKEITAYINYGINIVLNDETKELYDALGNRVYPITYQGTTYVPIRGVSNLLGVDVDWDSKNGNVLLTTKDYKRENLVIGNEKETDLSKLLVSEKDRSYIENGIEKVADNGLIVQAISNQDFQYKDYIGLSIKSDIKSVEFDVIDNTDNKCSINVFNQRGRLLKTFYLNSNDLSHYSFKIDGTYNSEIYFVCINQQTTENEKDFVRVLNIYGNK